MSFSWSCWAASIQITSWSFCRHPSSTDWRRPSRWDFLYVLFITSESHLTVVAAADVEVVGVVRQLSVFNLSVCPTSADLQVWISFLLLRLKCFSSLLCRSLKSTIWTRPQPTCWRREETSLELLLSCWRSQQNRLCVFVKVSLHDWTSLSLTFWLQWSPCRRWRRSWALSPLKVKRETLQETRRKEAARSRLWRLSGVPSMTSSSCVSRAPKASTSSRERLSYSPCTHPMLDSGPAMLMEKSNKSRSRQRKCRWRKSRMKRRIRTKTELITSFDLQWKKIHLTHTLTYIMKNESHIHHMPWSLVIKPETFSTDRKLE